MLHVTCTVCIAVLVFSLNLEPFSKLILVLGSCLVQVSLFGVFILHRDVTTNCLRKYIDLTISGPPPLCKVKTSIHIFKMHLYF